MTDAIDELSQVLSDPAEVLSDPAAMLFGLEAEFAVVSVVRTGPAAVKLIIEQAAREGPCPGCGVLSAAVKERPLVRVKDLPACGQQVELWWRKRRLWCRESLCPRRSFTQTCEVIRPRSSDHRTAPRQARVGDRRQQPAGVRRGRRVRRVMADRPQSARRGGGAVVAEPEPTSRLGIDETRFRSVRWWLDGITWKRSNPWLTSFVDCSPDGPGSLLGLAPGRSGGCVRDWLGEQTEQFRDAVEIVIIDPSAPYASGIRAALPHAKLAVDKWHLVALANQMVTEVRQRTTRDQLGRRGRNGDSAWVNRKTAPHRRRAPVSQAVATVHHHARHRRPDRRDRRRLGRQGTPPDAARRTRTSRRSGGAWPTSTRPRSTPECPKRPGSPARSRPGGRRSWSPSPNASSNARTEGFNRIIKQVKRAGCGYRNMINYQRRILTHIAVTRPQRSAA